MPEPSLVPPVILRLRLGLADTVTESDAAEAGSVLVVGSGAHHAWTWGAKLLPLAMFRTWRTKETLDVLGMTIAEFDVAVSSL